MNLAIDGYEYNNLVFTDYEIDLQILDGEGTGRSRADGWPMIRDPQGAIFNFTIEFGGVGDLNNSNNYDFNLLWQKCKSMGQNEFVSVRFRDPTGQTIAQDMYMVASPMKYKRITRDGIVYAHTFSINFIAKQGVQL